MRGYYEDKTAEGKRIRAMEKENEDLKLRIGELNIQYGEVLNNFYTIQYTLKQLVNAVETHDSVMGPNNSIEAYHARKDVKTYLTNAKKLLSVMEAKP